MRQRLHPPRLRGSAHAVPSSAAGRDSRIARSAGPAAHGQPLP
jgi:hypothetical protein